MSTNPLVSSSSGNHSRGSSRSSSPSAYLPSSSSRRRGTRRVVSTLRRIERGICALAKHFPLLIVLGGQTWAAYTEGWSISFVHMGGFKGAVLGTVGFAIYGLAVWSYLTGVFRDPGSPLSNKHSYSHLPTTEPSTSFPHGPITVKSTGSPRFCKKCQCRKPDRAHHCSTCNRCVLKMDHHCPWLATCLGLRNYKPFLLFLIYTSLLCILSFSVSTIYVYQTIFNSDDSQNNFDKANEITPVNWILLATVSGIIGLVLSGFTIWHIMLAMSGMTTIESLEKVRYSNPGLNPHSNFGFLGNGVDGGISDWSEAAERARARASYNSFLDDEQLSKLPHAFDLGKKQNLLNVFGTRRWAWFLPIDYSKEEQARLDGWKWETSPVWRAGVERVRRGREERLARELQQGYQPGATNPQPRHYPVRPQAPPQQQKLVARSAGETPVGVKPTNPGTGLASIEARVRSDWAFLDEDPAFVHATSHHNSDEDDDDSPSESMLSDSEISDQEDSGRRGLIDHLKLRGGKARKRDIYHQELYSSSAGSRGSRGKKNITAMMGAVPGNRRSKADRILGRSRYDSDDREGEAVPMRKLQKHVPLMVAAGRVAPPMMMSPDATSGDGSKSDREEQLMDLASPVTDRVVRGANDLAEGVRKGVLAATAVMAGVVDPGMVDKGEAKGQNDRIGQMQAQVKAQMDDWSRWGSGDLDDDDEEIGV